MSSETLTLTLTSALPFWSTVASTFMASIKSVGTACTLAGVGVYLHQRGFVVGNGKRTLALISQQVTIPLLFFTKILYCNQDWSPDPCPNVTQSLRDVWILLVWPLWVCTAGILVGYGITVIADVPKHQRNSILASVAFGNSTGLPITLLSVIHNNFGSSTALGSVDPTLFLSVYLVMYPVLQWGIGGMLLAPPVAATSKNKDKNKNKNTKSYNTMMNMNMNMNMKKDAVDTAPMKNVSLKIDENNQDDESVSLDDIVDPERQDGIKHQHHQQFSFKSSIRKSIDTTKNTLAHNVINRNPKMPETYQISHRGLDSTDASMYWSVQENLNRWGKPLYGTGTTQPTGSASNFAAGTTATADSSNSSSENEKDNNNDDKYGQGQCSIGIGMDLSARESIAEGLRGFDVPLPSSETSALMDATATTTNKYVNATDGCGANINIESSDSSQRSYTSYKSSSTSSTSLFSMSMSSQEKEQLIDTVIMVVQRCFQPPVIAALLGLLCASMPEVRGILVDINDREGHAPLQWFFDGLYDVGRAAVPINMIILGCNLSASYMLDATTNANTATATTTVTTTPTTTATAATTDSKFFSHQASILVVIGKMIVMPIVGVTSTMLLQKVYVVPQEIAGGLYLVLLVVFLCPTANNVMVMVELASGPDSASGHGGGAKESMARIIAYQYAVAPVVLSLTVTGAVLMASSMAGSPAV